MKRTLFLVLAAALVLGACAPAAQTPATTTVAATTVAATTAAATTAAAAVATTAAVGEAATSAAAMSADGAQSDAGAAPAPSHDEYWEATVATQLANYAGEQIGWFGELVKQKFNMGFNIIDAGGDKYATMLAAGEIGDFFALGSEENVRDAANLGLLLDWNKDGLLEKYGQTILQNFPKGIEKSKALYGNGEAIYGLGHDLVQSDLELEPNGGDDLWWGPYIRWDLYAKLGYPEINTIEDILPVLKEMQELEPMTPDGFPVYGLSLWGAGDSTMLGLAKEAACCVGYDAYGYVFAHGNQDIYEHILQEDGWYMRTLKWYFDANQMGLLDPDSVTQTFDDGTTKMREGRVLFCWFASLKGYNTEPNLSQGRGAMVLPMKDSYTYGYTYNPYGGFRTNGLGANCKYPERAMEFLNWMYSDEGAMEATNGPKGLTWDYDANNVPFLTELGLACYNDSGTEMPAEWGGSTFLDGNNKVTYAARAARSFDTTSGYRVTWEEWPMIKERAANPVLLDWQKHYGANSSKEYLLSHDQVCITINQCTYSTEQYPEMTEMLQQKLGQVGAIISQNSWKMVYAKDEAEYEQLKAEMLEKAYGLGYEEVLAYYVGQVEKLFADRALMQ